MKDYQKDYTLQHAITEIKYVLDILSNVEKQLLPVNFAKADMHVSISRLNNVLINLEKLISPTKIEESFASQQG